MARDPFEIRPAAPEDVPELFRVRTSVRENHQSQAELARLGITRPSVAELLASGEARAWCAEVKGRIAGFSMARATSRDVFALFVLPESEGCGMGSALLDAAVAWLRRIGPGPVRLRTGRGTRALRFYLARGWRELPPPEPGDALLELAAASLPRPDGGLPETTLHRIAPRRAAELGRWMDAYLSELARYRERPVGPTDSSGYRYLPLYWSEPGRHAFFIQAGGNRVGFVLVREVAEPAPPFTELAEFFIQPASRRAGLGRRAAATVWRRFPGRWQLQVALGNHPAAAFWPRCIEAASCTTVSREEFDGEDGRRLRYRFTVPAEPR